VPWCVLGRRAGWIQPNGNPVAVAQVPTLGLLTHLRRRPAAARIELLVVGDATDDLRYARAEAREVGLRFDIDPLLGGAATRDAVISRLRTASIAHLATHAFFNSASPLDSGIVLADGIVTARDILRERVHLDVLVLSSCESGRAQSLVGDELAGLAHAFLHAGVRCAVVSQWRVDDPASAALASRMYGGLKDGLDVAEALDAAIEHVRAEPAWSHPHFWGAFAVLGHASSLPGAPAFHAR
jgi:CHAT domain-containing protein